VRQQLWASACVKKADVATRFRKSLAEVQVPLWRGSAAKENGENRRRKTVVVVASLPAPQFSTQTAQRQGALK